MKFYIKKTSYRFILFLLSSLVAFQIYGQAHMPFCVEKAGSSIELRPFFPSNIQIDFKDLEISNAAFLLSQYIAYPSLDQEEEAAGLFYMHEAQNLGLHTTLLPGPNGEFNGVVSLYPLETAKPNIIFINHVDVVSAGDLSEWKFPPFEGVIAEGQVWGRGAYDNKGAAIAQLVALGEMSHRASNEDWAFNISILVLSGEERFSSSGAAYVADNYMDLLNPELFIGEGPAGLKGMIASKPDKEVFTVSVSHKRALWLRLKLEYESTGHGSVPPVNYPNKDLVTSVSRLINKKQPIEINAYNAGLLHGLGDLQGGWNGFFMKNIHILKPLASRFIRREPLYNALFSNTISLTEIKNFSDGHNSIPIRAEALLDCRLLPGQSTDDFLKKIRKQLRNEAIAIEIVKETPDAPPTHPSHMAYRMLEFAILQHYPSATVMPIMMPATIDSNFFRSKGYPVFSSVPILMTPELLKKVHAPNERVPIASLDMAVEVYKSFIINCINSLPQTKTYELSARRSN